LNYKLSKPRVYSTVTAAGSAHFHNITGKTTGTQTSGSVSWEGREYGDASLSSSSWTNLDTTSISSNTDNVLVSAGFATTTAGGATTIHFRVYDGTSYYPSSSGMEIHMPEISGELYCGWGTLEMPGNFNGKTLTFQAKPTFDRDVYWEIYPNSMTQHTHPITGIATETESSHTHGISYAITEKTYTTTDIIVKVDGVDKTSDIETAKGSALNSGDTETENGSHMELSSYLTGTLAGGWHYIEIEPNGNCRITADLFTQIFIESKGNVL